MASHPWSRAARMLGKRTKLADPIPKWKIVTGDIVQVIQGPKTEIGKSGKVLRVDRKQNRLYIEGVLEHTRRIRNEETNQTALVQSPAPVHYSNVALLDPKDGLPCKVKTQVIDGERVRYSTRTLSKIPKPHWERRDGISPLTYKDTPLDTSAEVVARETYRPSVLTLEESVLREMRRAAGLPE
ncbi:uncharacterized protein MONBRDRAFT_33418 [Monosiga brevicollis MX1]|uniref:Large ribosomal subunit protein uL24 C-terminal domain-containing protein n=1 Tax=Monosiga brevicollis TaxID=81824 RepID=A9V5A4_MONBE|nr:uncharacterized protein MONBRDRAFT_33418 [Monosiga brevicollis MX1]EDQ87243.1 predicted protein [Monosiga brevicollis MX1]|eukprot:XP_001747856.1 hypothetical protein [Monosiga brevicollis MX1]